MKRPYRQKPRHIQSLAEERISILFNEAKKAHAKDHKLADRYVELARKIAMKYKVRIPKELKRRFCKHCCSYLAPPKNCRVRLQKGKVVYYCLNCRKFMRFPY